MFSCIWVFWIDWRRDKFFNYTSKEKFHFNWNWNWIFVRLIVEIFLFFKKINQKMNIINIRYVPLYQLLIYNKMFFLFYYYFRCNFHTLYGKIKKIKKMNTRASFIYEKYVTLFLSLNIWVFVKNLLNCLNKKR